MTINPYESPRSIDIPAADSNWTWGEIALGFAMFAYAAACVIAGVLEFAAGVWLFWRLLAGFSPVGF